MQRKFNIYTDNEITEESTITLGVDMGNESDRLQLRPWSHRRVAYTHSDCSSSFSSLPVIHGSDCSSKFQQIWRSLVYWMETWRIPIAAIMAVGLSAGVCAMYGVFGLSYGAAQATIIGGVQLCGILAVQPLVYWSEIRIGKRIIMVAGAAASCGGLLSAAYADYLWQRCLAQGLLVGTGAGIIIAAVNRMVSSTALVAGAAIGGSVLALATGNSMTQPATVFQWLALGMAIGQLIAVILIGHQHSQISKSTSKLSEGIHINSAFRNEPQITTITTVSSDRATNHILLRRFGAALTGVAGEVLFYAGSSQLALVLPSYAQLQLQASAEESVALLVLLLVGVAGGTLGVQTLLQYVDAVVVAATARGVAGLAICLWLLPIRGWPTAVVLSTCSGLALGAAIGCVVERSRPWQVLLADAAAVFVGTAIGAQLLRGNSYTPLLAFLAATCLVSAATSAASAYFRLKLPIQQRS